MKIYTIILLLILPINAIASSESNYKKITNLVAPVNFFVNHIIKLDKIEDHLIKFKSASIVGVSGIGKCRL